MHKYTELKSDDTTLADKFQARLKYDTFKSEMVTNIKKLKVQLHQHMF